MRTAPSFKCHIILKEQKVGYLFTKNTVNPHLVGTCINQEECNQQLTEPVLVCVKMTDTTRIYNFDVSW